MENNFNGVHSQCAFHMDAETEYSKTSQKFYFGEKHCYTNLFHDTWFVVMHSLLSGYSEFRNTYLHKHTLNLFFVDEYQNFWEPGSYSSPW